MMPVTNLDWCIVNSVVDGDGGSLQVESEQNTFIFIKLQLPLVTPSRELKEIVFQRFTVRWSSYRF